MKTVYIDSEFKCHVAQAEGTTAVELEGFEEKCGKYIEGFRYVPAGERWTREDGVVFAGPMLAPFLDIQILDAYQSQYEQLMSQMDAAWKEGVNSI